MKKEQENNIDNMIFEFFAKVGIMVIISIGLAVITVLCEEWWNKDITLFSYFTMGYFDCLIFNWRWIKCQKEKRKK